MKGTAMGRAQPTVVCAWCLRVLTEGDRDVSHGICPECAAEVLRVAEEQWREGAARRGGLTARAKIGA